MERKRILVACEYSGVVRDAFRKLSHDAWSCDILPSDGDPAFHIQDDALNHLDWGWDLLIAHPPCTYLCVPGAHYLNTQDGRMAKMEAARDFFMAMLNAPIERICVENPMPHKRAKLPKYDQMVYPWMFGHEVSKRTCLWLKNLPPLKPTDLRENHGERYIRKDGTTSNSKWYAKSSAKERSKTFQGIADAMASQWSPLLHHGLQDK